MGRTPHASVRTIPSQERRTWLAALALAPFSALLPAAARAAGAAGTPPTPASTPAAVPAAKAASTCRPGDDWRSFAERHIQGDGRVIDFNSPRQQSTSEGQAYGLFFALVHNDRPRFEQVLAWTATNLAQGDLMQRLPAWQWGRTDAGSWDVLDANSASDADLWMAYALIEAGRLWRHAPYQSLGRALLARVASEETIALPGLGTMLLPWPRKIASGPLWRLNPSYLPLQLLRRFEQVDATGPWKEIADNTVRMVGAVAPKGFAPDWCAWSETGNDFVADPKHGTVGSYDAIRVYLWAGMLSAQEPARAALLQSLYGPRQRLAQGQPLPESVDTASGAATGTAPLGFAGAMLPYLKAQGLDSVLGTEVGRIGAAAPGVARAAGTTTTTTPAPAAAPLPYYERMLLLFGQAWLDGRFEFGRNGQLQTNWRNLCPPARPA
jgi:endo-1,4-beta-D-glucanase Y